MCVVAGLWIHLEKRNLTCQSQIFEASQWPSLSDRNIGHVSKIWLWVVRSIFHYTYCVPDTAETSLWPAVLVHWPRLNNLYASWLHTMTKQDKQYCCCLHRGDLLLFVHCKSYGTYKIPGVTSTNLSSGYSTVFTQRCINIIPYFNIGMESHSWSIICKQFVLPCKSEAHFSEHMVFNMIEPDKRLLHKWTTSIIIFNQQLLTSIVHVQVYIK